MDANAQGLLNQFATTRAGFGRVAGIDQYHPTTGAFCLVRRGVDQLVPRRVRNALGEAMVLEHPGRVQVLKDDNLIFARPPSGQFVGKVAGGSAWGLRASSPSIPSFASEPNRNHEFHTQWPQSGAGAARDIIHVSEVACLLPVAEDGQRSGLGDPLIPMAHVEARAWLAGAVEPCRRTG